MHLPLFLDIMLYQSPLIKAKSIFSYPCDIDAKLTFATCEDLGIIVADMLVNGVN
jgi:hypothetical protein